MKPYYVEQKVLGIGLTVDRADRLLAVYDSDRSIRSGTGMTVRLAEKKGITVIFIHPDSGIVQQC